MGQPQELARIPKPIIPEREGLTVQQTATALGLRCHSVYGLLRDGLLDGSKLPTGEWRIEAESVERYRLRRTVRHTATRNALRRSAIDVEATVSA